MPKAKAKNYTFEEALDELESIVNRLQSGQLTLDQALEEYEKSVSLIKLCENKLNECEKRITVLKLNNNEVQEVEFTDLDQ